MFYNEMSLGYLMAAFRALQKIPGLIKEMIPKKDKEKKSAKL
ncbi:MAG: hypothetical protein N3B21_04315 [Clostridia bacterium]|nr:hypothetical protein [Clostridia bacterium]